MRQRFTVELERTPIYRAAVEVVATDIVDAHRKAIDAARDHQVEWTESCIDPVVMKITAHAGEVKDETPSL